MKSATSRIAIHLSEHKHIKLQLRLICNEVLYAGSSVDLALPKLLGTCSHGQVASQGYGEIADDEGLMLLEVCAGVHRITSAAQEFGMSALAMDAPRHVSLHSQFRPR